jgi:hypothetical protein
MDKIPLEYLIETIAKALCFEKYVALNNIEDFEKVNMLKAVEYYEEQKDQYLHKSYELLTLFHDFDKESLVQEGSDTIH